MRSLTFVELIAVLFTGIAGFASAVQAFVSWETRGEVSRAIVFAQRIDACAKVMAAIEPFVAKARDDGPAVVKRGGPEKRYSLPQFYYRRSAGNAAFDAKHKPRVQKWREASAAFLIVSPDSAESQVAFFNKVITKEIPAGRFMNQSLFLEWLEQVKLTSQEMTKGCRGLL
jgi:hypothetical protein